MIQNSTPINHLAEIDHQLLMYLRRFGKPLDEVLTVGDLNQELGYQPGFLKMLLNTYFNLPEQNKSEIEKQFYPDLIRYLRESHTYYTNVAFPQINRSLETILNQDDPSVPAAFICQTFIQHYAHKMALHFEEEERSLFPLAEKLMAVNFVCGLSDLNNYSIVLMIENEHESLNEELKRVHEVLLRFRLSERSYSPIHGVLAFMSVLQRDIKLHELIEDEILLPFVTCRLNAIRIMKN